MATFDLDLTLSQGNFTLDFKAGADSRALALFGPSGSGKTSALEAIAGLRQPQRGRIAVNGRTLFDRAAHVDVPTRLRRVGYVPQDILLFPHLDVRRNVTYGQHAPRAADAALLELLDLHPLMDRRVESLSGGERQRVAIARALCSAPELLLFDEPLAAVDLPRRSKILSVLLRIRDELKVPLVYVTHSPEEARTIADYAIVLDGGRMVAAGSPQDVLPA